jgi:hypothetical protein
VLGIATHGTDPQRGKNIFGKVKKMKEDRGDSLGKIVGVAMDGAGNMSSENVGAATFVVEASNGAVSSFVYVSSCMNIRWGACVWEEVGESRAVS